MSAHRTLRDLRRGAEARPVDVLRLAMHYILRGGWIATPPRRLADVARRVAQIDHPITISEAVERARQDLSASWMIGLRATQALSFAAGLRTESPEPFKAWTRDPARTADDVRALFRACIEALRDDPKGTVLDVAV